MDVALQAMTSTHSVKLNEYLPCAKAFTSYIHTQEARKAENFTYIRERVCEVYT